jgi:hypothetical protein
MSDSTILMQSHTDKNIFLLLERIEYMYMFQIILLLVVLWRYHNSQKQPLCLVLWEKKELYLTDYHLVPTTS